MGGREGKEKREGRERKGRVKREEREEGGLEKGERGGGHGPFTDIEWLPCEGFLALLAVLLPLIYTV